MSSTNGFTADSSSNATTMSKANMACESGSSGCSSSGVFTSPEELGLALPHYLHSARTTLSLTQLGQRRCGHIGSGVDDEGVDVSGKACNDCKVCRVIQIHYKER